MEGGGLDNIYIPDEIVHDILKRLPLKSLLRCKAVCKSWRSLISEPRLIKSHLDLATKKWENVAYCHLPRDLNRSSQSLSVNLSFINREASDVKTVHLDIPCTNPVYYYPNYERQPHGSNVFKYSGVLGSCNGLVLVGYMSLTLLFNPSTGECSRLATKNAMLYNNNDDFYISGLSYDSSLHEYKAMIVFEQIHDGGGVLHMYVCSTSILKIWKKVVVRVDEFPYDIRYLTIRAGITVNGAPHWVVNDSRDSSSSRKTIIYFDPMEEKIKKLPAPPPLYSSHQKLTNIAVLGGCLCTILYNFSKPRRGAFEVWALKEYGVKESWTKLFVIRMPSNPWSLMPLGFTRDGSETVLLIDKSKLVAYNLNTKEENLIVSTNFYDSGAVYVESLVSPKRIKKMKEMPT